MKDRRIHRGGLLTAIVLAVFQIGPGSVLATEKLGPTLSRIEQRLKEESKTSPSEPNSLTYLRAMGEKPVRSVSPRQTEAPRVLTLDECLQSAFTNSNEIKQAREQILAVGGSKLINNSRFMPSVEMISQYEHFRNFGASDATDDATSVSARISQRLFEYGKDNPLDVTLRRDQRDALFNYENVIANVFWKVRNAFFFIKLKEQQIAKRQQLLEQFEKQHEIKKQRMEENNLSTKMEVLTAYLNVLTERSAINALEREEFNRKIELLRLIGLPVGAGHVEFEGKMDTFALGEFDMNVMIHLALAQSTQVALADAIVAEQQRVLNQLRFEYLPDLRASTGYQDENGKVGADLLNDDDTWAFDVFGQPKLPVTKESQSQSLGIFGDDVTLGGPDPGWYAGLQLRIPITEGGARTGRQIRARALLNSFKAALEDQKDRIEQTVRQSYNLLAEQKFQVELAQQNVNIESQRFMIKTQLRDIGKITDDELETFRRLFFNAQDSLFAEQELLIERQEDLRLAIRFFK
ncbi:MAG: TolC family protein [Sedimentisphaerales bacterium]|jgi:outer membrane protein TolC